MITICFKILLTIIFGSLIIIPVSILCVIDIIFKNFDVNDLEKSFRGKFFLYITEYTIRLFLLSLALIFPLGLIWIIYNMWN